MLWFFWRNRRLRAADAQTDIGWLRDPLNHPSIAGMSAEQLADLPPAELRARLRN